MAAIVAFRLFKAGNFANGIWGPLKCQWTHLKELFEGYEHYILFIDFEVNKLYIIRRWFGFWRPPRSSGLYGLKSAIRRSSRKICERAAGSKARKPGRVVNIEVPLTNLLASSRWPCAWLATSKTASFSLDSSSGVCGPFSTGRASNPCFNIVSAGIIISPCARKLTGQFMQDWVFNFWFSSHLRS